ncbi:MAG: hypothetical protein KGS47_02175 [Chloroflexi bacterium]|nr:hypothetical protein [Chloroflexota bacterium]
MDTNPGGTPGGQSAAFEDEQRFSEWAHKRLSLYQTVDQQIQARIEQAVQFASTLTRQMEQEAELLLGRYREMRLEQQNARDLLVKEIADLRAQSAQERAAATAEINQMRIQAQAEMQQLRQHTEAELARREAEAQSRITHDLQQAEADLNAMRQQAETEVAQMLQDAYEERDRLRTETRSLSDRLAGLQRSLADLFQITGAVNPAGAAEPPAERPRVVPPAPRPTPPPPPAPRATPPVAPPPQPVRPVGSTPVPPAPRSETPAAKPPVVPPPVVSPPPVVPPPVAPPPPAVPPRAETRQVTPPDAAQAEGETAANRFHVEVSDVRNFVIASELIDQISRANGIRNVQLLRYEQRLLELNITADDVAALAQVLRVDMADTLRPGEASGRTLRFAYVS